MRPRLTRARLPGRRELRDLEAHRDVQSERFGGQRLARVREEGAVRLQMHNVLRGLPRVLLLALLVGLAVVVGAPPHEVEGLAVVGRRARDDGDDPLVWLTILFIRVARLTAGGRRAPRRGSFPATHACGSCGRSGRGGRRMCARAEVCRGAPHARRCGQGGFWRGHKSAKPLATLKACKGWDQRWRD